MKRFCAAIALILTLCGGLFGCTPGRKEEEGVSMNIYETYWSDPEACGLRVEDGRLMMAGIPFYGAGVNSYDLFLQCLADFSPAKARESLRVLKEHGIRFVRFSISVYYYDEMEAYTSDPERYFGLLRKVADAAEEMQIGLIPSFFWHNNTIPDFFDEPFRAWGDRQSRTFGFLKTFTAGAVEALADSKAVWAWEFGNEFDLACDLPNAAEQMVHSPLPAHSDRTERTEEDFLKVSDVRTAMEGFSETVMAGDPRARMISSGFASMRPSQYNQTAHGSWQQDTREERRTVTALFYPDGVTAVSEHLYFLEQQTFGETLSLKDYIGEIRAIAASLGKPYIIGEWGPAGEADDAFCAAFARAVLDNRVQLSMIWNFNLEDRIEHSFTADSERGAYLLSVVRELDAALQAD